MKLNEEEFKKVILEIGECFKMGAITPMFQEILDNYKEELEKN